MLQDVAKAPRLAALVQFVMRL